MTTTSQLQTRTLQAPGATLTYDIRRTSSTEPILMLIGSPMGAAGFATLASHFAERTVATYDPRGVERSQKDDPASPSTPEQHADDLHRVIQALGAGPVDLFASSGGAVNALALVERHPEQVRTLVAHEPPVFGVLPDGEIALAAARDIHETYMRAGFGAGMAKFIVLLQHKGPLPSDWLDRPAPDAAMFGLPTDDDGARTDALLAQNMVSCTGFAPDFDGLRRASTRIVIGAGTDSEGELANRGALGVAERLGTTPVIFPSDHGGFLGGEYGQTGDPAGFAAKLRQVLTNPS